MGSIRIDFLRILARLHPEIWDVIGGGHSGHHLGPHPEPWALRDQVAAVRLTFRLADSAAAAQTLGADGVKLLSVAVDDWCGNGVLRFPFPPKSAGPGDGEHPPRPDEAHSAAAIFAAASASFAVLAGQVKDEAMRNALDDAAVRTAEQALQIQNG